MAPCMQAGMAEAVTSVSRQKLVHEFIQEHVLQHMGSADTWNLPFVHIPLLDIFRYDWVMLLSSFVIFFLIVNKVRRRGDQLIPRGWVNALEAYVVFIRNQIAVPNLGSDDGRRMTPFFCTLFLFILVLNLLGVCPLFSAATGNISVTMALATVFFVLAVGGSVRRQGVAGFLRTFVPTGAPKLLLPFLVLMEIVSLVSRTFALMVRLFANMMAGHIMLFAMLGMVVIFGLYAVPVVLLVVGLFFFEIFVAIFQAYIFTVLSAVFMGMLWHPEHAAH